MGDLNTFNEKYTTRLLKEEAVWWKKLLPTQAPYRYHIRRLQLGFTLDIGCGTGRHLSHLSDNGVGVDHNASSVQVARKRGHLAFTPEEFIASEYCTPGRFDAALLSHVAEHLNEEDLLQLLATYLPYVKPAGAVVIITPQEHGFRSDPTHVRFLDFETLEQSVASLGLQIVHKYSFPLPRFFGRVFKHNEFVSIFRIPGKSRSPDQQPPTIEVNSCTGISQ